MDNDLVVGVLMILVLLVIPIFLIFLKLFLSEKYKLRIFFLL